MGFALILLSVGCFIYSRVPSCKWKWTFTIQRRKCLKIWDGIEMADAGGWFLSCRVAIKISFWWDSCQWFRLWVSNFPREPWYRKLAKDNLWKYGDECEDEGIDTLDFYVQVHMKHYCFSKSYSQVCPHGEETSTEVWGFLDSNKIPRGVFLRVSEKEDSDFEIEWNIISGIGHSHSRKP